MSYGADKLKMGYGVNFFFTLKVKVNYPSPQTIGTLTKVFCIFGPNLVIIPWTGDEL